MESEVGKEPNSEMNLYILEKEPIKKEVSFLKKHTTEFSLLKILFFVENSIFEKGVWTLTCASNKFSDHFH